MKDFFIVLKFELLNFLKNKTFIISTVIICLMIGVGLSIPTIKDTFFSPSKDKGGIEETIGKDITYGYTNENGVLANPKDLEESFTSGKLIEFNNQNKLEEAVNSGEIEAGFILETSTKYKYVVINNEMMDSNRYDFENSLVRAHRIEGFKDLGIEYTEVEHIVSTQIEHEIKVLGKDSAGNFMYTYILVFGLYFIIILYGQLISVSVASEKSNRAMEVLITSTKSSNLIFGKVIGGALAGAIQFGIVILTGILAYNLNSVAWNNELDFIFKIPGNVLFTFSVFGILGYLFYAFIYGALGALVSRTEDINTSATPITMVFIVVFMISMMGMQNTEGIVLKVASFVPFSSFMAMFVRVSMGSVSNYEVIISLVILLISTGLIGVLASAIYRLGTLMYGNPVKFTSAIKLLRKQ